MSWLSLEERIRVRVKHLMRHGDAVKIADYSAKRRAPEPGLSAQNLSYFLNGHRKRPLGINDVEDVALYFNLSVAELFTPGHKSELSGAEQRLLAAHAGASPEVQAAAVVLLEAADRGPSTKGAPRRRFAGGHAIAALATRPTPVLDAS
jgi:hypothetical protein